MQVLPEATHLIITCGDGFYETVAIDLIESDERIMLAYAWDGRPIPFDHGFPFANLVARPVRHETAQVDNRHRSDRRVRTRLLGRA